MVSRFFDKCDSEFWLLCLGEWPEMEKIYLPFKWKQKKTREVPTCLPDRCLIWSSRQVCEWGMTLALSVWRLSSATCSWATAKSFGLPIRQQSEVRHRQTWLLGTFTSAFQSQTFYLPLSYLSLFGSLESSYHLCLLLLRFYFSAGSQAIWFSTW